MNPTRKVGRITVAAGLVAFGVALLLDNLGLYAGITNLILKFWPLLLIGFGLEYLVFTILAQRDGGEYRLRFDGGGTFLLALIIIAAAAVSGFRTWVLPHLSDNGIVVGAGPSETRTAEPVSVPASGAKALNVDLRVGSVTLQEEPGAKDIRVEATYTVRGVQVGSARDLLDQIKLNVTEGETVQIRVDAPSSLNNLSADLTVIAPPGLRVKANTGTGKLLVNNYTGDITLDSNTGRVEVQRGAGSLSARSGSGGVTVRSFDGPVDARTNVGSIETSDTIGALQLDATTGSITVRNHRGGKLVAETRTGRIDTHLNAALEGDAILKSQTGSVVFAVPQQSSMRATAQTRTGGVQAPSFMTVSRNGTSNSAVGTLGDGKWTVSLEAGTGSIQFNLH